MNKIKIYLAGACKNEPDEGREWRETAKKLLTQAAEWCGTKCTVINPIEYFSYSEHKHKSHKQVKRFYMDKISKCGVVLVNLKNTENSCGTCMEIQYAVDHNIPVVGFGNENAYPWLSEVDCDVIFANLMEAVDYIRDYYIKNYD